VALVCRTFVVPSRLSPDTPEKFDISARQEACRGCHPIGWLEAHHTKARLDAHICSLTRAFERRKLHTCDAARTTATWVSARCEVTRTQAKHDESLGAAMEALPVTEAAFRAGTIGRGKARSMADIRTPEIAHVVDAEEAFLVEQIAKMGWSRPIGGCGAGSSRPG
jgi:hypothetical protein